MADANASPTEPDEVATSDRAESTASSYFTVPTQNTERGPLHTQPQIFADQQSHKTQESGTSDQGSIQHLAQEPAQEPTSISFREPIQERSHELNQTQIQDSNQVPIQHATIGFGSASSDSATLHDAIRARDLDGVHILLNQGADSEIENEHGEKPLYLACRLEFLEAVWPLLEAGADPQSFHPGSSVHSTALQWAVEHKWLSVAEALLMHGADVNTPNPSGTTALITAIEGRNIQMTRLLLRYGADKNVIDQHGNTPTTLSQGFIDIESLFKRSQGPPTSNLGQGSRTDKILVHRPRPPIQNCDKMIACHNMDAMVVEFRIGQFEERKQNKVSVYELLYGTVSVAEPSDGGEESGHHTHLPANNVSLASSKP